MTFGKAPNPAPVREFASAVESSEWLTTLERLYPSTDQPGKAWLQIARPAQLPPAGDWFVWLIKAGRGWGKTRVGAEWIDGEARKARPGEQLLIAGRTPSDVRDYALHGSGGLLTHHPDIVYEPANRLLRWPNGALGLIRSGANPEEFRGASVARAWLDEFAAWDYPQECWSNLSFGLREGDPRICITTTPRVIDTLRRLMTRPSTVVVSGRSYENRANLSEKWVTEVLDPLEGTRLGRQEIEGELLEDVEGALWRLGEIDDARVHAEQVPALVRVVVGVDPQGVKAPGSETGIVVVGMAQDGSMFVVEDGSINGTPSEWGARAVACYERHKAGLIVGERNYGGEMVEQTIRVVSKAANFKLVVATRGKIKRAEPVAALYEKGRVHHVGTFAALEDEMCSFTGADTDRSPNRMDACIVGDALIETASGRQRLDSICAGDSVLTRAGWRAVEAARCVGVRPTLSVELSSGELLVATPDHLVWTEERGWSRVDALVCGDILCGCKPSSTVESSSLGQLARNTSRLREDPGLKCFTARSTRATSGRSQAGTSSTTEIETLSTTRQRILSRSLAPPTTRSIAPRDRCEPHPLVSVSTSPTSSISQRSGTGQEKAGSGTGATPSRCGGRANQGRLGARSAESSASLGKSRSGSALGDAGAERRTGKDATRSPQNVPSARRSSSRTDTEESPRRAPVSVARISAGTEARVYDLQVAGAHEFVASGVVVHNCVWAISTLLEDPPRVLTRATWGLGPR